jgi:hypothetical protein
MLLVLISAAQPGVAAAQQGAKPDAAGQGADDTAPSSPTPSAEEQREAVRARNIATLNDKTPLQVQVVVSRYQGDKRISSMPYMLSVNAIGSNEPLSRGENSQLRMRGEVPVPTTSFAPADADKTDGLKPVASFNYRAIGTNIDCRARTMGDGRFELGVSVEDTSVFTDIEAAAVPGFGQMPVFRSFQASHTLILRDGESRQFTAATDRITGEVVRIDVTLTLVK